jgi:hypothetical protein
VCASCVTAVQSIVGASGPMRSLHRNVLQCGPRVPEGSALICDNLSWHPEPVNQPIGIFTVHIASSRSAGGLRDATQAVRVSW